MVKNIYMKVIGGLTKTDILPGQNVPHFMGENGHFSIKNKLISISVYISLIENLPIYCHNFYESFGQKKQKKPYRIKLVSLLQWSEYSFLMTICSITRNRSVGYTFFAENRYVLNWN